MKLIIIFTLFLQIIPFAMAGDEGPHGGDSYAFEFNVLARALAKGSVEPKFKNFFPFHDKTVIYSDNSDIVQVNGQEVDAINFPSKKVIILNRKRWREKSIYQKLSLIVHELFGIQGIELDSFEISSEYEEEIARVGNKIIVEKPYLVSYHSFRTAFKPLYISQDSCDLSISNVANTVMQAKKAAINKCEAETGQVCKVRETSMKTRSSTKIQGMSFCEIEVLVKTE